jgi:hypothetical protein
MFPLPLSCVFHYSMTIVTLPALPACTRDVSHSKLDMTSHADIPGADADGVVKAPVMIRTVAGDRAPGTYEDDRHYNAGPTA